MTYYHVNMEAWMGGYPSDWDYIQSTYRSIAPKDLGSMGYNGLTTMYIPKQTQMNAFSTGQALEFYRNWNSSWHRPWDFFNNISSINISQLLPCNTSTSVMQNDATMRRHVKFTNDIDGVVIENVAWLFGTMSLHHDLPFILGC